MIGNPDVHLVSAFLYAPERTFYQRFSLAFHLPGAIGRGSSEGYRDAEFDFEQLLRFFADCSPAQTTLLCPQHPSRVLSIRPLTARAKKKGTRQICLWILGQLRTADSNRPRYLGR